MSGTQKIRSILFYLSVAAFFGGLPFILSFALGYKLNYHTLKFARTGLIAIKSQPPGASIYLNGKLLQDKTPATISELLPERYNLRIELEDCYPWSGEVGVGAGKVVMLDKIILFPLRPNIKQLNKDRVYSFLADFEGNEIYYINPRDKNIYLTDLEGEKEEWLARAAEIESAPLRWRLSEDKEKAVYFNLHQIVVCHLSPGGERAPLQPPFIFNYSGRQLIDVFWHSDSYHLIVVTSRNIEVLEASPDSKAVSLVNLNKVKRYNSTVAYDQRADNLYFLDSQQAADGKFYRNLYKLELSSKTGALFREIRKATAPFEKEVFKSNERESKVK